MYFDLNVFLVLKFYRPQRSCDKVMFSEASVWQTPLWADTPLPGQTSPEQTPPRRTPPGRHSPAQCMLGYTSPLRPLQRMVRVLLECILVCVFLLTPFLDTILGKICCFEPPKNTNWNISLITYLHNWVFCKLSSMQECQYCQLGFSCIIRN